FEAAARGHIRRLPVGFTVPIVPIEAAAPGDVQVFAARDPHKFGEPVIDAGVLADFPSVESVVASTRLVSTRDVPSIREVLFTLGAPAPDAATLRRFPALTALHLKSGTGAHRLDLEGLAASEMRKLSVSRWFVKSLAPLQHMTGLRQLSADLFRDSLDSVA